MKSEWTERRIAVRISTELLAGCEVNEDIVRIYLNDRILCDVILEDLTGGFSNITVVPMELPIVSIAVAVRTNGDDGAEHGDTKTGRSK